MSHKPIKAILLVEDNLGDARLLQEILREEGLRGTILTHVQSMQEAEAHLATHEVDLIMLDLGLPDAQGLAAVERAHAAAPNVPLVVLTGLDDESVAARALQEGAQDYLVKGQITSTSGQIETRGLLRAMRYAVERKVMEGALFAEKERAEVTLNCIGDAVICSDVRGNITFLNLVAEVMTGWPRDAAAGQPVAKVLRIVSGFNREMVDPMDMTRGGQDRISHPASDSILIRRDGFEIPIEDSVAPIHDREGQAAGAVIVFRDVSAARSRALRITHSAEHDFLTGLPNRMLLNDRVGQAIALAKRHVNKVAVLFFDLDGFKRINDTLGHAAGDKLLQSIGERLVDCVRASDTVSRQGGDEFVVLLSEVENSEDVAIAARRMLQAVATVHSIDQHDLHVTTSIGVSVYPDDGSDAATLIKNADTAMYQAKKNGRQGCQFFKPAMNIRAVERQSIEEGLRLALERQEFSLLYQPKVDLMAGAICGAEALIRWRHPTRGMVPPAQFIPVAEDCGLIQPIGAWALREACVQARAWAAAGLPLKSMAVNISAIEFRAAAFLKGVYGILDETGLDPNLLELELTESTLMTHAESTITKLQVLRERGVRVAVDDFGAGYSSLGYLQRFSIDALKIGRSFVGEIGGVGDAPIVRVVIGIAHGLRLRVIAQGVRKLDEVEFLRVHQCDEAQGSFFSQAVAPLDFAKLLELGKAESSADLTADRRTLEVRGARHDIAVAR